MNPFITFASDYKLNNYVTSTRNLQKSRNYNARSRKKMGVTYVLYAAVSGNPTIGKLQEIAYVLAVDVVDLLGIPKEGVIYCPKCGTEIKLNPEI